MTSFWGIGLSQRLKPLLPRLKSGASTIRVGGFRENGSIGISVEPGIEMFLDEGVVGEMRVEMADAIDFFELAGREIFVRVEAPATFEQALPAQNFVDAGNAAGELMA